MLALRYERKYLFSVLVLTRNGGAGTDRNEMSAIGGMKMIRSWLFATTLIVMVGISIASCSSGGAQSAAPAQSAGQQSAEQMVPAGKSEKVDLDKIFPTGPGRDLTLNNCTNCHTITPIVVLQLDKEAWERSGRDHRERVYAMSDAEFNTMYDYLIANFNPDKPIPQLPKELLDTWTSY